MCFTFLWLCRCYPALFQLSFLHSIVSELVRSAEIWFRIGFDALRGSGNPEIQASWRVLWQPVAQIPHMGSDKSKGEIKNSTAPPGSAKTTPKIVVQKQLR